MKLFITKFLACLLLSVLVYSSAHTQSNNGNECEFNEPIFLTDVFNYIPSADCYFFVDDSYYVSSEEIISHPDGSSLNLICGPVNGFTTIQSATFVDLKPGFNSGDGVFAGFEARIAPCDSGCPTVGAPCDDLDPCTINDGYTACSTCQGTPAGDSDNDTVCDPIDQCPNFDDLLLGAPCDDLDLCTINDVYTACSTCQGTPAGDSDNDTVCDPIDQCPNFDDLLLGMPCDDLDPCTINDVYTACSTCQGTVDLTQCPYNLSEFDNCTVMNLAGVGVNFSGVTYNPSTDLFTGVRNNPEAAIEFDRTGDVKRLITLDGFDDTEGIVHISGDTYAITEERIRNVVIIDIPSGNSNITINVNAATAVIHIPGADNTDTNGELIGANNGFEGITYDSVNDVLYVGREKDIRGVYTVQNPLSISGNVTVPATQPFNLENILGSYQGGLIDLAGLSFTPNGTLLILSEESDNIVEVNATSGAFISNLVLRNSSNTLLFDQPEGVTTISQDEFMVVGEADEFAIFTRGGCINSFTVNQSNIPTEVTVSSEYKIDHTNYTFPFSTEVESDLNSNFTSNISNEFTVYPNPFIDQAKVELDLVANERVRIDVIDLQGKLVKTAFDQNDVKKGHHVFDLQSDDLESGLYFIRVLIGDFIETKKITKL